MHVRVEMGKKKGNIYRTPGENGLISTRHCARLSAAFHCSFVLIILLYLFVRSVKLLAYGKDFFLMLLETK